MRVAPCAVSSIAYCMSRLECSADQVVEQEMVLVCTPVGWGPHQANRGLMKLPGCKPNACPNLLDKKIKQGGWDCRKHNTTKSCKNHRTGEVCSLKCEKGFKVWTYHGAILQVGISFKHVSGSFGPYKCLFRDRVVAEC